MPNVLIRDIPQEDLELLDEQARRAGLSRADFLRRQLQQQARRCARSVAVEELEVIAQMLQYLGDDDVMADAWRCRQGRAANCSLRSPVNRCSACDDQSALCEGTRP